MPRMRILLVWLKRHLRAHAELARMTGVPRERIVLAEDGVVVDLVDGKAEIVGAVPCGYVFVDGLEVGDVGETTLKDRRILGDELRREEERLGQMQQEFNRGEPERPEDEWHQGRRYLRRHGDRRGDARHHENGRNPCER